MKMNPPCALLENEIRKLGGNEDKDQLHRILELATKVIKLNRKNLKNLILLLFSFVLLLDCSIILLF